MKHKGIFKRIFIPSLVLILILSTTPVAFAATTDSWVTKEPMADPRIDFQAEVINGKIYAIGGQQSGSSVEEYDPVSNTWTTKASMSTARYDHQTQVVNGKIYAIGGHNSIGDAYLSSVEEYDPALNTWTKKASMNIPRYEFQTVVVAGEIFAIGGYTTGTVRTSSVEEYDPTSNTWTTKASMSSSSGSFKTEVIGEKIYAIGGGDSRDGLLLVEEYDLASNTWTKKASTTPVKGGFQTEVIGGKIYAIGGWNGGSAISAVEEYDPISDIWTTKKPMSTPRLSLQTEVVDGKIYAFGGEKDGNATCLTSVEEYDPTSNAWTVKPSMSVPRSRFQSQIINGKIYAIGGLTKDSTSTHTLSSLEEYTATSTEPTLSVAASSDKVKVGEQFTTAVAIHNVTNICAEDINITYDTNLFEYVGAEAQTGLKIYKEDNSTPGTIRFIVASLGKDNAATGDKGLINLKFKAKKPGVGKVDIIKGRIADNATLEMDVTEANCGEATITVEAVKDVNRSGEFTLIDLGVDAWYYGMNAADTDTTKFDTDVVVDGKIDDSDLSSITQSILSNSNYQQL